MSSTPTPVTPDVFALIGRYRDAYLVGNTIAGLGTSIKIFGVVIGILIAGVTWWLGENLFLDRDPAILIATLVGLLFGGGIFIIGILVSAQGHVLVASIDSAVNSSPFLDNGHRAKIMGLPGGERNIYIARSTISIAE